MRRTTHKIRRGDKVNDKRRIPHANGFISYVIYDEGPSEVIVKYDNGYETYDYEEFRNCWTDSYGGAYELVNPIDPKTGSPIGS